MQIVFTLRMLSFRLKTKSGTDETRRHGRTDRRLPELVRIARGIDPVRREGDNSLEIRALGPMRRAAYRCRRSGITSVRLPLLQRPGSDPTGPCRKPNRADI
jgi:hypothetical protein